MVRRDVHILEGASLCGPSPAQRPVKAIGRSHLQFHACRLTTLSQEAIYIVLSIVPSWAKQADCVDIGPGKKLLDASTVGSERVFAGDDAGAACMG